MDEGRFWISVWAIVVFGVCAFAGEAFWLASTYNAQYFDAMNRCTQSGGTFVPTSSGICIKH